MITEEEVRQRMLRLADYAVTRPLRVTDPPVRQTGRRAGRLVVSASVVTVAAAVVALVLATTGGHGKVVRTGIADSPPPGVVTDLPAAPIPSLSASASAWTGSEWLIWGGRLPDRQGTTTNVGAAYRPSTSTWTVLPAAPIAGRQNAVSVWTGTEWIIAGGVDTKGDPLTSAATFDPEDNRWSTLPALPEPPGADATAVWTGKEMIVVTGDVNLSLPNSGKGYVEAFNPDTGRWTLLPTAPGNLIFGPVHLTWSGSTLYVVRSPAGSYLSDGSSVGEPSNSPSTSLPMGQIPNPILAALNVSNVTWSTVKLPAGNQPYLDLEWYDGRLLLLQSLDGGSLLQVDDQDRLILSSEPFSQPEGYAYYPISRTWRPLAGTPNTGLIYGLVGSNQPPAWTGTTAYYWAGGKFGQAYDAATDTWYTYPASLTYWPGGGVDGNILVWTGTALLVWGGTTGTGAQVGTPFGGISYQPNN